MVSDGDLSASIERLRQARAALLQERKRLLAEVAEVDRKLKQLSQFMRPGDGDERLKRPTGAVYAAVVRAIQENGGKATFSELSPAVGVPREQLGNTLFRMVKRGLIRADGTRRRYIYRLSEGS